MTTSYERNELAVVTGASTGIGAATARELSARGFHVLAGVRRDRDADAIRAPGIEPVIIDIADPDHVAALATRVREHPAGRPLRALVNNAGIGVNAPVETFELDRWRELFEVNLFGHVALTQALLPALFASRGRIVNIGSVGGRIAMATYGPYAATKFALEAVSDALRREVAHTGVDVVVIEPGAVLTKMLRRARAAADDETSAMTPEQRQRYGGLMHAIGAQAASSAESGVSAEAVAGVIARAITVPTPRTRYTVGREAGLLRLLPLLPDRAVDRLLAAALRPHFPLPSTSHEQRGIRC
jgi:NAD(P)-dependent dehydrogenase (short-subunit alcohol dehydrogenase family)